MLRQMPNNIKALYYRHLTQPKHNAVFIADLEIITTFKSITD